MTVLDTINEKGFSAYLHGFGAIDSWLGSKETSNFIHILTNADTADLAKLFENLRYPGVDLADAALDENDSTWYFRCVDSIKDNITSFNILDFYQDCKTKAFIDPHGIFTTLKKISHNLFKIDDILNPNTDHVRVLTDTTLILAKYFAPDCGAEKHIDKISALFKNRQENFSKEEQRVFLCELITSPNPGLGFELLKASGFISKFWPELAILEQAKHSKEFHPEGNAWEHTMETFRHRKTACDLRLSLGLLLHDSGKPKAASTGGHRYDGHAELGEIQARRFLERLGFNPSVTQEICFLVRNHMLPAALPRLPLFRTEQIMSSPLFPLLMELYRCDEASSFKGLDGYYESSAAYQQFLRNRRNPYRTADGKKLNKKQKSKTGKIK
jgi:poly(A) polymerase